MSADAVTENLLAWVGRELLTDETADLTAQSPLLEWGVLNSFSMVTLVDYLEQQFGVRVPPEHMVPTHFRSVEAIASLVKSLEGARA